MKRMKSKRILIDKEVLGDSYMTSFPGDIFAKIDEKSRVVIEEKLIVYYYIDGYYSNMI